METAIRKGVSFMGKLDGKVAIVTGGGTGIGKAIAETSAKERAKVVIVGRREEKLKQVCDNNSGISYVVADITKTDNIKNIIKYVDDNFGGQLDILVNNAGWCPVAPLKELSIADYDKAFNLDVRALVEMTIESLPLILKSKGNIINLSTVGATHRAPNLSMYIGGKGAVENFTRCWALELAADGVRVNAIAPGAIKTDIWNVPGLSEEESKKHQEGIIKGIPCGRMAEPYEVANVALFLASNDASYVSGAIYAVDGASGAV